MNFQKASGTTLTQLSLPFIVLDSHCYAAIWGLQFHRGHVSKSNIEFLYRVAPTVRMEGGLGKTKCIGWRRSNRKTFDCRWYKRLGHTYVRRLLRVGGSQRQVAFSVELPIVKTSRLAFVELLHLIGAVLDTNLVFDLYLFRVVIG